MAYTTKWFSEFDDESGDNIYSVEILDRDYSGAPIEVLSGGSPVSIQMMDVDNAFQPLRSLKFTFEWISDEISGFDISDLFITDDKKYQFKFSKYDGENKVLLYTGYLVFIECQEPFSSKPYPVTISATCSLPFVRDDYFLTDTGQFVEGKVSLIKIIASCLSSTGLQLPIHTYVNLFEEGMTVGNQSPLSLAEIDSDGLRGKKGGEVLEGILGALNAFIVQSEGAWIIKGVREQAGFFGECRSFDHLGEPTGYSINQQAVSIGRTKYNIDTPNLRPESDVEEFFAEPNSIASVTVSPGIAVNRLPNGTFSGAIFSGNIPGWVDNFNALQHPIAPGWTRSGTGNPGDPYKIDITGADTYGSTGTPSNIHIPNPIVINTGVWDEIRNRDSKVKLVISGAYRAADISWFKLYIRLNDGDKNRVSFLDQNGAWQSSKKKQQFFYQVDVDVPANPPNTYSLEDSPLQTFEITTDKITDFLNRDGDSVAKFYFEVRAGYVTTNKSKFHNLNPRLTWEDFSVCVTTETKFEGEHSYKVDAKFPIRNPNSAEHTIIIADKINIETPEQRRPENRVMTGYMTLTGTNTLTKGWRRFRSGSPMNNDSGFEPIQKKCLRERIRLYCGKRRMIDGPFKGVGLFPHNSIFNRYDNSGTPFEYFTIQSWEWKPKQMEYNTSFLELNFSELENENIELVGDSSGTRGDRMYSGAGGSSTQNGGSGSSGTMEEILLDDIEPFEYEILVADEEERILDIGELIVSEHTPDLLEAKILFREDWITEISLYRGEDLEPEDLPEGGLLQVLWKGKPVKSGNFQILVELTAYTGADYIISIPLLVTPSEDFIEEWPPVFIDLPDLVFEKGKESTQTLNIFDFLDPEGEHDGTGLSPKLTGKPFWISDTSIVFGVLSVTGKATQLGTDYLTYELSDAIGRAITVPFVVKVVEPVKFEHEIPGLGEIPGSYELPEEFQVITTTTGTFDRWEASLTGGGATGNDVSELWDSVTPLPTITAVAGQYKYTYKAFRSDVLVNEEVVTFLLYDEEYLAKLKAVVTVSGSELAEISLDGTTQVVFFEKGNLTAVVDEIIHTKAWLDLDGVAKEITTVADEYIYFDEDTPIAEGEHVFTVSLYDGTTLVEKRVYRFTVGKEDPKPEGGLKLVTYKTGTTNYSVVEELSLSGSILDMPDNYSVLYDGEYEGLGTWELYKFGETNFTQIYTRIVPNVSKSLIFGNKNSLQITDAHGIGRYRVILTIKDASGEVVEILQSDFTFREKLAPGSYSGLEFLALDTAGDNSYVVDKSMPKVGGKYPKPTAPIFWIVRFFRFPDNAEFDQITLEFKKGGVVLNTGGAGLFLMDRLFTPTTDLGTGLEIYTFGFNPGDNNRILNGIGVGNTSIDELTTYTVIVTGYRSGVEIGKLETEFELIAPIVEEPELDDCCCDGNEGDFDPWLEKGW